MGSKAKKRPKIGSLEDLIRSKEIEFFSYGRKLDTDLKDFGTYNLNLVKHVLPKAGNKISLKGVALEQYLSKPENLYSFAEFLIQFWYHGVSVQKKQHLAVHVDVDMDKLSSHYQKPTEEKLVNFSGQVVGDAASWVPEMPYFEKLWNFALDQAVGGMVGYPGYEHPRNDLSFRIRAAELAENYMIGTKQQIQRYRKYALESLNHVTGIADGLKNDPESIFDNYDQLQGLEMVSRHARIIAENIAHFSLGK